MAEYVMLLYLTFQHFVEWYMNMTEGLRFLLSGQHDSVVMWRYFLIYCLLLCFPQLLNGFFLVCVPVTAHIMIVCFYFWISEWLPIYSQSSHES